MLLQVFAIGRSESSWKLIEGQGSNPIGGVLGAPVTNIRTSSNVNLKVRPVPSVGDLTETVPLPAGMKKQDIINRQ